MIFTDYLAFIQVAIAFNFGSVFWRERKQKGGVANNEPTSDVIEELCRRDDLKNQMPTDDSDECSQEISSLMKKLTSSTPESIKKQFFTIKRDLTRYNTEILNKYQRIGNYDCSVCFSCVCLFFGLYGLMQLCLLPDVDNCVFIRNVYLFFTEILLWILGILLFVDLYCMYKWEPKTSYFYKTSIGAFVVLLLIALLFSLLMMTGCFEPGTLPWKEDSFIYSSIYITYLSFIIYFIMNLLEVVRELYIVKIKIPQLQNKRKALLAELSQVVEGL